IAAQCKRERVEEAILRLHPPLPDEVVRQVAIVARGYLPVRRSLPRVIVIVHHVAVGTCAWVVAHIRESAAVAEGKCADPAEQPQSQRKYEGKKADAPQRGNPPI